MKHAITFGFFGMCGAVMVYLNSYEVQQTINTVFVYMGYALGLLFVLTVLYAVLRYIVPSINDALDRYTDRKLKQQFISADSTTGLYPLRVDYYQHRETLQALLMAAVQAQVENPHTILNSPTVAPSLVESTQHALPDKVLLSDYLDSIKSGNFALGVQPNGKLLEVPYPQVWHLLNAAQSGSGKTNNVDSFICQVHLSPHSQVDLYATDFKGELSAVWSRSPKICAIASGACLPDIEEIILLLAHEVHIRNETFRQAQAQYPNEIIRGYASYRTVTGKPLSLKYLIVDELNSLMAATKGNERLRVALGTVLQMGRSAGVNAICSGQHLTADVLPREHYTNFATRVIGGVYSPSDTVRLLGAKPAPEHIALVNGAPGRALIKVNGIQQPVPIQTLLVTDRDILDSIRYASGNYGVNTESRIDSIGIQNDTMTGNVKNGENDTVCQSVKMYAEADNSTFAIDIPDYDRKYWYCKVLSEQGMSATEIKKQVWGTPNGRTYQTIKAEYDAIMTRIEQERR